MRVVAGILSIAVAVLVANPAEARRGHHHRDHHRVTTLHKTSISHRSSFGAGRKHGALKVHRARRAAGTHGRPSAWCGWWLGNHLGMADRRLWVARNWAQVGHNIGKPQVGVVVVWRHHVGLITGRVGDQWIVKSGNDGRRVRERPRSIARAIAFRAV